MTGPLTRPVRPIGQDGGVGRKLLAELFAEARIGVYALLDGASIPDLREALYVWQPEHECLYRGELAPDLAETAPYLVRMKAQSDFSSWVMEKGWGNHWGVYALSYADLPALRRHLRRFLVVHDPDGKPLYFRFYDPRVLRVYLPTCNSQELGQWFGPVSAYVTEAEDPGRMLWFESFKGELVSEERRLREEQ